MGSTRPRDPPAQAAQRCARALQHRQGGALRTPTGHSTSTGRGTGAGPQDGRLSASSGQEPPLPCHWGCRLHHLQLASASTTDPTANPTRSPMSHQRRPTTTTFRHLAGCWLKARLAAWLPGCLAAWLLGCLAAWLLGCLAAWLVCHRLVAKLFRATALVQALPKPYPAQHQITS